MQVTNGPLQYVTPRSACAGALLGFKVMENNPAFSNEQD